MPTSVVYSVVTHLPNGKRVNPMEAQSTVGTKAARTPTALKSLRPFGAVSKPTCTPKVCRTTAFL